MSVNFSSLKGTILWLKSKIKGQICDKNINRKRMEKCLRAINESCVTSPEFPFSITLLSFPRNTFKIICNHFRKLRHFWRGINHLLYTLVTRHAHICEDDTAKYRSTVEFDFWGCQFCQLALPIIVKACHIAQSTMGWHIFSRNSLF